jgi:predicted AAA+ superfamily ATPase
MKITEQQKELLKNTAWNLKLQDLQDNEEAVKFAIKYWGKSALSEASDRLKDKEEIVNLAIEKEVNTEKEWQHTYNPYNGGLGKIYAKITDEKRKFNINLCLAYASERVCDILIANSLQKEIVAKMKKAIRF